MLERAYHAVTGYVAGIVGSYRNSRTEKSARSKVNAIDCELRKLREAEYFRPPVSRRQSYSIYSFLDMENRKNELAIERELLVRQNPDLLKDED